MNPQTQSDTVRKIAASVLIAAVALGIGYYAGQYVGRQRQDRILKEIFSGGIFANGANLFGEITAIAPDKNSLSVKVSTAMSATLPKEYQNKTVLITADTKIVLREHKTPEALSEEMEKYQMSIASAKGTKNAVVLTPPNPYSERAITIGELKVGDAIDFSFSSATGGSATLLNHQFTSLTVAVTR
jgi:hypothetical protein